MFDNFLCLLLQYVEIYPYLLIPTFHLANLSKFITYLSSVAQIFTVFIEL